MVQIYETYINQTARKGCPNTVNVYVIVYPSVCLLFIFTLRNKTPFLIFNGIDPKKHGLVAFNMFPSIIIFAPSLL